MAQPALIRDSRQMLSDRIVSTLEGMPEKLRETFRLTHYGDRNVSDVAEKLGVTREQARQMIEEANRLFFELLPGGPSRIL